MVAMFIVYSECAKLPLQVWGGLYLDTLYGGCVTIANTCDQVRYMTYQPPSINGIVSKMFGCLAQKGFVCCTLTI